MISLRLFGTVLAILSPHISSTTGKMPFVHLYLFRSIRWHLRSQLNFGEFFYMSRIVYPASSMCMPVQYRFATIQYITFMFCVVLCCCHTVPALPSQSVEHVSSITVMIMTLTVLVQYVSDDGALRLLQHSDHALSITFNLSKWRFLLMFCGGKRQHPSGARGT